MQNDFCHPEGWLAHIGVDVTPARTPIAPLQRLLPALRGHDVPVIWVNWGNRPDRLNLSPALLHVYKPTGAGVGLGDASAGLRRQGAGTRQLVGGDRGRAGARSVGHSCRQSTGCPGFQDTELDSILRNLGSPPCCSPASTPTSACCARCRMRIFAAMTVCCWRIAPPPPRPITASPRRFTTSSNALALSSDREAIVLSRWRKRRRHVSDVQS